METIRRIDKLGRITLPKEIREKFKMREGEQIKIGENKGKIIIERDTQHCKICGSKKNVDSELFICLDCIKTIKERR